MPNKLPPQPISATPDGFLTIDQDWNIAYAGGSAPAGPPAGQNLWQACPQWAGGPLEAALRQAMQSGAPQQIELDGPQPDQWREFHIYPHGPGLAVLWTDITPHKQAEQALRQSQTREAARLNELQAVMDAAPAIIWVTRDPQARLVTGNQAAHKFLRLQRGQNLSKSAPDDQAPRHFRVFRDGQELPPEALPLQIAAASGQPVRDFEEEVVFDDGDRASLLGNVTPLLDESGQPAGAVAAFIDVTARIQAGQALRQALAERQQVEAALRQRSERLALLSEAAAALLHNVDPGGLLKQIYPRLAALLDLDAYLLYRLSKDETELELDAIAGFPRAQRETLQRLPVGQAVCGWVAQHRQPQIVQDVQSTSDERTHLIRSLAIQAYACHPLLVNQRLVGTLSFGSHTRTHFDPETISLIRAVCDLIAAAIDRRSAELNSQRYAEQLERSNRDLQEFAFVASHELQEPLRKIETFGDILLQRGDNLTSTQRDYLDRMRQAAVRMRDMVTGLLTLSRLGRDAQPFAPTDLTQAVAEAVSNLELRVQRAQAHIEADPLPTLEADPLQMTRLFQNLIGNAIKFQPPGGRPYVRIYPRRLEDGQTAIVVEDNGIGVPPEAAERIFQPFQRAVGRSEYEGSGMGLAICRKIVERHGGQISVQNRPGGGAAFLVILPALASPAPDADE